MKKKFIVYKEKTIIYATIVEAKDEEEAYEICDYYEKDSSIIAEDKNWIKITSCENLTEDEPETLNENNKKHKKILNMSSI